MKASSGRRALLLALLPICASARAEDAALEALMRRFAQLPRSRASFTEEKALPELDLPLPSEGVLSWQAPDRLEKHTTSPIDEVLRVQGRHLAYERPDRGIRRDFNLDEQPEMRALVEAIRSETHSCYLGDRSQLHPWGFGCGHCPACDLRRRGWDAWQADRQEDTAHD